MCNCCLPSSMVLWDYSWPLNNTNLDRLGPRTCRVPCKQTAYTYRIHKHSPGIRMCFSPPWDSLVSLFFVPADSVGRLLPLNIRHMGSCPVYVLYDTWSRVSYQRLSVGGGRSQSRLGSELMTGGRGGWGPSTLHRWLKVQWYIQRNCEFSFLEVVDGSWGGGRGSSVEHKAVTVILKLLRAKQRGDEASHLSLVADLRVALNSETLLYSQRPEEETHTWRLRWHLYQ